MSGTDQDIQRHEASQLGAADPGLSAWVAANAGSGKTSVLVNRVTRLLLTGTGPGRILCLTFTKAAAAEMALRLNSRLGAWAVMSDDRLQAELTGLLGRPPVTGELGEARRLFARTLEAPGGLRLQTVHAFCEALLKRFPVEARVPPHFRVADEANTRELLEAAQNDVLRSAADDPAMKAALLFMAERLDDGRLTRLLQALIGRRRDLAETLEAHGGADGALGALRALLNLPQGGKAAEVLAAHVAMMPITELQAAAAALAGGSKTDHDRAKQMRVWLGGSRQPERLQEDWMPAFLTKKFEPRDRLCTKATEKLLPGTGDILAAEQLRLVSLMQTLRAFGILDATEAVLRLGEQLLRHYSRLKQAQGLLDYDDLILRTRDLLTEPGRVAWVMYKLDHGIAHVLVDEAQDTSPEQWQVIRGLTDEFFAGAGRQTAPRTVFAVGDVKQSIYSFQGARPREFADMREHFRHAVEAVGQTFRDVQLEMSFRSSPAVLNLVDAVFAGPAAQGGVVDSGQALRHQAKRACEPGRVELWPPIAPVDTPDPADWDMPLDYIHQDDPKLLLARHIAQQVRDWIGREILPSSGRPIRAGDIIILVRRRNPFFDAMVRELKRAQVAVAGADRMKLGEQIVVQDLLALAQFCLLPQDDLTLATVLRGPLFDFTDEDLFALCHGRGANRLWQVLKQRADEQPHWQRAAVELRDLLGRTDFTTPFGFFTELLGAGHGRRRLVARLGPEANEPIDEFLAACMTFEREHAPSLQSFVSWFENLTADVKRDMDQGRDEVRVLTVHAAKGLEAPIVILPDTCDLPVAREDEGLLWSDAPGRGHGSTTPLLLWPPRREFDVEVSAAAREIRKKAISEEYRRLLYVALTRARDRLYVCGYLGRRNRASGPAAGSWYDLIRTGFAQLSPLTSHPLPWPDAMAQRYETGGDAGVPADALPETAIPASLPAWCRAPPPAEPDPALPLSPSRPEREGPAPLSPTMPGREQGLKRGRLIHRLLQSLPELPAAEHPAATARFLAHPAHGLDSRDQADIGSEVLRLMGDPVFSDLFGPDSLAEAPIVGRLQARVIAGRIDRLIVKPDRVLVLDFKTDRPPPDRWQDVSSAYLQQMALYCALIHKVFPGRELRAALLWTYAPKLMELPVADIRRLTRT